LGNVTVAIICFDMRLFLSPPKESAERITPENRKPQEEMNGLSDALTIGLVLALVFGALSFYIYTRLGQVEKRVSLTENILLDLKIATENTIMSMSAPPEGSPASASASASRHEEQLRHELQQEHEHEQQQQNEEQAPDEEFYKQVLQQAVVVPSDAPTATLDETQASAKVDVNYESMTLKELKALAKQRSVNVPASAHKKDVIDLLKRQNQSSVLEPGAGTLGNGGLLSADEGFPVELGSTESRTAE
jgi:hypothetical protein